MAEPLLEARGITKRFGQVLALDRTDFAVYPGEIVALIGDNGAGKSTLVKTLSGTIRPDAGQILVSGKVVHLGSPLDARRHGIETVYQDLALAPDLDAAANLHLGREIYLIPFLKVLDRRTMRQRASAAFGELGIELPDVGAPVVSLSGGQRQSVAVARAVAFASQVIFMDEPTAALGVLQRGRVLETMRRVRERGISIVLISHNMPEVLAVADRVEVLRLGRRVARYRTADTSVEELVGAMTGALEANGGAFGGADDAAHDGAHDGGDGARDGQNGAGAGTAGGGDPGSGAPDTGAGPAGPAGEERG
jgi:simple sugar transport system ATP-binding protein